MKNSKLNIVFVIPSLAVGGQEKAGMVLCNFLNEHYNLKIVTFEGKNKNDFDYQSEIERIEIPIAKNLFSKILIVIKRVLILRKIKKRYYADISISFGETACLANSLTFSSEPKIATIQQSTKALFSNGSLIYKSIIYSIYKIIFAASTKIVSVSESNKSFLNNFFKSNKTINIFNAVDLQDINAKSSNSIPNNLNPFFNGRTICHVGRFHWQKGHWHLAKIFCRIKKEVKDSKLLLLGGIDSSDGSKGEEIYSHVISYFKKNGLIVMEKDKDDLSHLENIESADVLILGHQKNPYQYMKKSDLFLFPTLWEGFPSALTEALSCGLPILSSNCDSGPNEIIIEGDNMKYGFLFPPFELKMNLNDNENSSYNLWVQKVVEIFSDPKYLSELKNNVKNKASEFSIQHSGKQWISVINSIVNQ